MASLTPTQTHSEWIIFVMRERINYAGMCYRYALRWPSPRAWSAWGNAMRSCRVWKNTAVANLMARDFN